MANKSKPEQGRVAIRSEVVRQIRAHARSSMKAEVCGVLIGRESGKSVEVEACIQGANAEQAGTHVTFTQNTWEHIYQVKDKEYPDHRIVGWYHSHPGFGIFLSDHDLFIHKSFFSAEQQVAWVYDPHSDEEGCFGWRGNQIVRLSQISFLDIDSKAAEAADEPAARKNAAPAHTDEPAPDAPRIVVHDHDQPGAKPRNWAVVALTHILLMLIGFAVARLFFPRPVPMIIDPRTGRAIIVPPEFLEDFLRGMPRTDGQAAPPAPGATGGSR